MKLSTRGRYGLRAVHYLAEKQDKGYVSVAEISQKLNISENYLEQLIRLLKNNDIVVSARGVNGGYKLSRDLDEISVGEVLRVLEGQITSSECVSKGKCDEIEECEAYLVFAKIDNAINSAVDSITIRDMINNNIK